MASIYLAEDFTSQISEIISPTSYAIGGLYLGNITAAENQ